MYKLVKSYRDNEELRNSFNELAEKTFGLNFENWYQNGFWIDNYNPYSIVKDGKVIANVSVNRTDMMWNGKKKTLIQLGTVMTEESYRNQGLIRRIMEEIDNEYMDKIDGMYLFGNDRVVEFYPKFGFRPSFETEYYKEVQNNEEVSMKQICMNKKEEWYDFQKQIENCERFSSFEMVENSQLYMFYISQFMQENVYYSESLNAHAIAEVEGSELYIHGVISEDDVELEKVIQAFGKQIQKVTLGFTPINKQGFISCEHKKEDCTLFLKGNVFEAFEKEGFMFQTLAHA